MTEEKLDANGVLGYGFEVTAAGRLSKEAAEHTWVTLDKLRDDLQRINATGTNKMYRVLSRRGNKT